MASSNEKRRYPPRLYGEGKSPLQKRSMHHNCKLSCFGMLRDYIGDDVYDEIAKNSQVGRLLQLADSGYVWCAKHVHHLLSNQLYVERRHEIWFLLEGSPLRFSLNEFSEITGLNCDSIDTEKRLEVDHTEFWSLLKVDPKVGPCWDELDAAIRNCRTWHKDKRKMLALLFIVNVGIEGKSRSTRIPLEYAKTVLDEEAFERFPWGRVSFKSLVDSIKVVTLGNESYTIHGCVHALYIWAFEHIPVLGKKHGSKKEGAIVPLLGWDAGLKRFSVGDFLAEEKARNGKLEVKHMVAKPLEDIYPVWPDENIPFGERESGYKVLDNLLHDIVYNCLDENIVWEVASDGVEKKKKKKSKILLDDTEDDFVDGPPLKKRRETSSSNANAKKGKNVSKKSKEVMDEEDSAGESDRDMHETGAGFEGLLKVIGALRGQIGDMESNLSGRLDGLDSKVEGMDKKIGGIEKEIEILKICRSEKTDEKTDESQSNSSEDGASEGKSEMKETSEEGFPISVLVRNPKSKVKAGIRRTIKTEPVEVKAEDTKRNGPVVVDLTKDPKTPENKKTTVLPHFIETPQEMAFTNELEKLLKVAAKEDFVQKKRRPMKVAPNQLDTYVGSSIVRRMMRGVVLSKTAYDPFAKADPKKIEKLIAFIKHDLDNPLETSNGAAHFYLKIATPKQMWPLKDVNYGWLCDSHLASAMHMLRKRSMQETSPFLGNNIAFLDPWFVNQWAHDYKRFEKTKNWIFPQEYVDVYAGKSPIYNMTHKRWVDDVQFLYLFHNIENKHWIAVQVDLKNRRVKAFDSCNGFKINAQVEESCKPYTRMIPLLMHDVASEADKKILGTAAFTFYRVKTAPQNIQEGDCGVYALKYIECLAIGLNFIGLCDAAMPVIRLKLAAELFDEVPDTDCFIQMSDPNSRPAESGQVQFNSETNK